jgi:hypothetical protein
VVATRVGGIPDVVTSPALGALVPARDPLALSRALVECAWPALRSAGGVRPAAPGGWDDSAARLHAVLLAAGAQATGGDRDLGGG